MEGGDSRLVRVSTVATAAVSVPAPAHQVRRMLSDLFPGHGTAPQNRLPQTSSAQRRVMPMAPPLQRWHANDGTGVPVASLLVNQVCVNGLVVSIFLVTTVRRQQGLLYRNTGAHPMVAPAPAPLTTQMPAVQNTMPATVAPVTGQRIINHRAMHLTRATSASQGLCDAVSPVAVHGNGNPLACIFCRRVFALRSSEILALLPPRVFSYPEPIGLPPLPLSLPLPLAPAGDACLTAPMCSDAHHFCLTMQHMPRQAMANLIWSSQIDNIQIAVPTPAGGHGGQHVGMASSSPGITSTTVLPTLNLTQMPVIHREQHALPPIMSSSSTSPVDITTGTVPPMLNMMPMQAIRREQHAPPPTTLSSSASGLLCEYVMPEHEDMVCLTLGRSCTMDLDLSL